MKDHGRTKLLKSAGSVGIFTFASRITGYIRDAALAAVLGAGASMDAFTVAFRLANLLRQFFAEGVMTAAFVPVFADFREHHSPAELWEFSRKFFYTLGLILFLFVALQMVFSPAIINLMAPGFRATSSEWLLAVDLNRWMCPFLLFVGLAAVLMAVLNSQGVFAVPAAAPICFNVAMIASAFTASRFFEEPAYGVAAGVLLGGAAQFLVQIPAAVRSGMDFRPSLSLTHPAVQRVFRLMGPGMFGIGIVQINMFVDSIIASLLPEGSISAIYYANRVMELALGIFVVSIATVMLPEMSRHAARKNHEEMQKTLSFSLRMVMFVALPASVGLLILSRPIIQVLFEHGRFTASDTMRTTSALAFFAIGLIFIGGVRIMVSAFYSVKDTRTPVQCAAISLVVNIIGDLLLMVPLKQAGLALSTSISSAINFFQLAYYYRKKIGPLDGPALRGSLGKSAASSFFLALTCMAGLKFFPAHAHFLPQALVLFGTIGAGLGVYLLASFLLKSQEFSTVIRTLGTRRAFWRGTDKKTRGGAI